PIAVPTFRWLAIVPLAVLAVPFFGACAGGFPPFSTPYEEYRGFKARTFVGTAKDVKPIVVATLLDLGYDVHEASEDEFFVTAAQGMGNQEPNIAGDRRTWIRVGVQIRQVDMHRRAPRTLVEIEAENVQGTSDGPINASHGSVPSTFYQGFFKQIEARVDASQPRVVRGFMPPA
ncbi:MAG: hypothetical protein ACJAQ3_004214, partial [Planctomycetota bacterium]